MMNRWVVVECKWIEEDKMYKTILKHAQKSKEIRVRYFPYKVAKNDLVNLPVYV